MLFLRRLMMRNDMSFCRRNNNGKSKMILCGVLFLVTVFRLVLGSFESNDVDTAFKQFDDVEYNQIVENDD